MKLILILATFSSSAFASKQNDHRRALQAKFPYGLLGDDFGILNERDLEANTCSRHPVPFPPPTVNPYSYWQCFQTKNTRLKCEDAGKDPDLKTGSLAFLVLDVHDELGHQEYMSRRPFDLVGCASYRRVWKQLTRHQRHVCVSGEYLSDKPDDGENVRSWIFDKYKTKTGCDSYGGECDTRKYIKDECAPATSG